MTLSNRVNYYRVNECVVGEFSLGELTALIFKLPNHNKNRGF